jgi:transcriptional regulator with XRE-family HTH domain
MLKVNEITLGASLRQHRVSRGLSVRAAAAKAGIAPMYLSLLERDACGPPSDEKLQSLAEVLGEPHAERLFAKAGRVTPRVVSTILRHPTEWSELIEAWKNLDGKQLKSLTEATFWAKARDQVRSMEASMDKEIEDFMDKEMVSGKSTREKKAKKKGLKSLTAATFCAKARAQVRSVEASMDKEIEDFMDKKMVMETRTVGKKGKKKGRKQPDGVLARISS